MSKYEKNRRRFLEHPRSSFRPRVDHGNEVTYDTFCYFNGASRDEMTQLDRSIDRESKDRYEKKSLEKRRPRTGRGIRPE